MTATYGHDGHTLAAGNGRNTHTFNPATWLDGLVQIGGGYALASGRKLWLLVEKCDADDLASVMRPLMGEPARVEAIRCAIERRSHGEKA